MDHHCPWFNNCVSFSTYKFFLLTLFYIILLGAYASASTSLYFWHSNPRRHLLKHSIHISFLVLVGATVVFVMGGFLCMHLVFVARNRSTIENIQRPKFRENGDSFNLGIRRNFMEVFGTNAAMWTLPVHTSLGDGVRFPTRLHPEPDAPTSGAPHESATTAPASSSGNAISSLTGRAPSDNEENLPTGEAATKGSVSAGEATIGSPGRKLAACSA
ncbi:palmitoyltransferase ZDHHC20-B-like [Haemaphysalis longicornis]